MNIYKEIQEERLRQQDKYGDPDLFEIERLGILLEEVGEVAKEVNAITHYNQFPEHYNPDYNNLKDELIQVAALCVQWLESYKIQ